MTTYEATAAAAEYLMASGWACEESVRATAEQGVSDDDREAIREAFPAAADAEAVIAALGEMCRERGSEDRTIYCHGCGVTILSSESHMHDGDGYCDVCEAAPAEEA